MFEARLAEITQVLTDPDLTAAYTTDFTRRFSGAARAVVRPGTVAEVAGVVGLCAAEGVPIVPQGGNTGLVGGGVPTGGEVVLSLRRLDALGPVDVAGMQVTAGAGVVLADLQSHVRAAGLDFGVDFAARSSATVGGMIATNAGGERVLRHGTTRASVVGLEAVLADGGITSRLSGLPKDNTGFELPFAGSEGILGIITAARLRLVPLLAARSTALLALDDLDAALAALGVLRALGTLEAAEFFLPAGLRLVCEHTGLPLPFDRPYGLYLLVECAARTDPGPDLMDALASLDVLREAVVGVDATDRHRLWTYREAHTEAISARGVVLKLDIALPLTELTGFLAALDGRTGPCEAYHFGHLAEGNVHVNLIGVSEPEVVTNSVLRAVSEAGGSISAEHGVGRAKARWLHLSRSPAELSALRAVKRALDPAGILNPGCLLPPNSGDR
ncbi:MAG: FAD-binding oxidoreductase [Streptosporangiaceae bacterium]